MDAVLKPLHREAEVRRIVAWDIETTPTDMKPFLVGVRWGQHDCQAIQFDGPDCIAKTLDWLLEDSDRYPDTSYYAHNGGGFDHQFIIHEAVARRSGLFRVSPVVNGGSSILVFIREKGSGRQLALFDSLRLFIAQSLSSIGKKMGGSLKGEMDLKAPISDPRWKEYNNRDTLVLWEAVSKLQSAVLDLGGEVRATAASTSMDLFRRRYLRREIAPIRSLHAFFRSVYVGGRTEVFDLRNRQGPINYYDVNSLYPYACLRPLPVELTEKGHKPINGFPDYNRATECIFGNCLVEVPDSVRVPPLPVRSGGKLIFPVGRFWGNWSTPDLDNLLLSGGRVVRTQRWYRFNCEPIAREMMTELYAQRKSERPEMQVAAKGLMNAFYGKFGQKPERDKLVFYPDAGDMDEGTWRAYDEDETVWQGETVKDEVHIIPQIAAHVTSLARSIHYPYLHQCRDLIYCDTDSLVTTDVLSTSDALGAMKLEHEGIQSFQAIAPKTYKMTLSRDEFEKRREKDKDAKPFVEHAKGFGGWAKEAYEGGIVSHLASGGSVRVRGPMKLLSLLKSGDLTPREKRGKDGDLGQVKKLQARISKRIVNDDGTTRPIKLMEG